MWLPKDERLVLLLYYHLAMLKSEEQGRPMLELKVPAMEACGVLEVRTRWCMGGYSKVKGIANGIYEKVERSTGNAESETDGKALLSPFTLGAINSILKDRGLVQIVNDNMLCPIIKLTIEGYDLGRKYTEWFDRTGLWFSEYKDHWIWIIASFLGGVFGTTLVRGVT